MCSSAARAGERVAQGEWLPCVVGMGGKKKRAKNAGKKAAQSAQAKADAKRKKRIVEDKTFGLKNKKKSNKVKKYIQQVTSQTMGGDHRRTARAAPSAKVRAVP